MNENPPKPNKESLDLDSINVIYNSYNISYNLSCPIDRLGVVNMTTCN